MGRVVVGGARPSFAGFRVRAPRGFSGLGGAGWAGRGRHVLVGRWRGRADRSGGDGGCAGGGGGAGGGQVQRQGQHQAGEDAGEDGRHGQQRGGDRKSV